jgi:putative ABC transport system permease protein
MLFNALLMALREIRRNLMRSGLTTLGIVIGVAAVIAMVALGRGATDRVTGEISSLGQNMLILVPGNQRQMGTVTSASPFTLSDARAVGAEVAGISAVAPTTGRALRLVYASKNRSSGVTGTTREFFDVRTWPLERGRLWTEAEQRAAALTCVIGETVKRELFGAQDPLGATLRLEKLNCEVVGVLTARGQNTFGNDQDDFVAVPIATYQRRIAGNDDVGAIMISAKTSADTTAVQRSVEALMRQRRGIQPGEEDDFVVRDLKEVTQVVAATTGVLTALLSSIAAVSLLVGGIGIMNIMLVSVTERTREIGIRLAIGARGREVLLQFLVEAVVLSMFGGVLGVAVGLGGAYAATYFLKLPFSTPVGMIFVAFGFSLLVGVFFGFFPARKAARLNPIDALRYE